MRYIKCSTYLLTCYILLTYLFNLLATIDQVYLSTLSLVRSFDKYASFFLASAPVRFSAFEHNIV